MSRSVYEGGILRQRWENTTRLYTEWDATGVQTLQRPFTAEENIFADAQAAAELLESNRTTIETQAATALTDNTAFLAIAAPTNAQTLTQVKALTRQMNKLIRLTINDLTGTD